MHIERKSGAGNQQQENEQHRYTFLHIHGTKLPKNLLERANKMLFFYFLLLVIKGRNEQQQEQRLNQETPHIEKDEIISCIGKTQQQKESGNQNNEENQV